MENEDACAVLRRVPGFAGVPDAGLAMIASRCSRVTFPTGGTIVAQGRIDHECFILLAGTAAVSVAVEIGAGRVATLAAGALVGEIALLCDLPRTATVVAEEPVEALVVTRELLPVLVEQAPGFAVAMLQALAGRLERNVGAIAYFHIAAQELQRGSFDVAALGPIAQRQDEAGAFARAFAAMADAVREREVKLRQEVATLRIEIDEARKVKQVAEITDTPEFQTLLARAQAMRARRTPGGPR